jgi:hypothetical protein
MVLDYDSNLDSIKATGKHKARSTSKAELGEVAQRVAEHETMLFDLI